MTSTTDTAGPPAADPVVIVGSGLAGWSLARELRQRDPAARIAVVCADRGDFYSKPMLSNALAQGKDCDQLVQKRAAQQAQALGVMLSTDTRVVAIDRASRTLHTTGPLIRYSALVLALGADAIRLPTPGMEHAYSVNDIDDYRRFRAALAQAGPAARVALIGGGLIGSEFANDLASAGFRVHVIDPAPWPIAGLIAREQGEALQRALEGLGVSFHLGDVVERIEVQRPAHAAVADTATLDSPGPYRLTLRSGASIDAAVVLSAVGLRPRTDLAQQAGLITRRGIPVDEMGRTSDPDIYALGDCAAYASAAKPGVADGAARPLPYILPIMSAARAIAATLAGTPTAIRFGSMPVRVKTPALPLTIPG
jgi:rubredoxin-NAD+ reductase